MLLTGDLGFTVARAVRRALPRPLLQRRRRRAEHGRRRDRPRRGRASCRSSYSIATFASLRPYEFIRNGPVLHQLPVRIVGVGGGFDYGHERHHALRARGRRGDAHAARDDRRRARRPPAGARGARRDARPARPGLLPARQGRRPTTVPGSTAASRSGGAERIGDGTRRRARRDRRDRRTRPARRPSCSSAQRRRRRGRRRASRQPRPAEDLAERSAGVPLARDRRGALRPAGSARSSPRSIAEHGLRCRRRALRRRAVCPTGVGSEAFLNDAHGLSARAIAQTAMQALERR